MINKQNELDRVIDPERMDRGRLIRAFAVVVLASVLSFALHKSGWLAVFENATLDLVSQTRHLSLRNMAEHIIVVEITNDDYRELFQSRSPLNSEKLAEIISAIAAGEPASIVVDIDTSSPDHKPLGESYNTARTIWASSWTELGADETASLVGVVTPEALPLLPLCRRTVLIPEKILGGQEDKARKGLAFLPVDIDGSIRRYCRRLQVVDQSTGKLSMMDSLPWAVVKHYKPELEVRESNEENEVAVEFLKNVSTLPSISADELLKSFDKPGWKDMARGKIVILGGTFEEARDVYKTRAGRLPGVRLLAQVIATELESGGIRIVGDAWLFFAQLAIGLLYLAGNYFIASSWWSLAGLVLIPLAAVSFSALALSNLALWANFVPTLFVVQIYALYEHIQDIRRKNADLESTNKALKQARTALAQGIDELSQEERKRVSEHLHDETMMDLFQIEVALSPLRDENRAEDIYLAAIEKLQLTRQHVREIMDNLFPTVLKNAGLTTCIDSLSRSVSTDEVRIDFVDSTSGALDEVKMSDQYRIYRILQNAIRNALQHAGASELTITARVKDGSLVFTVEDDGKGFDGKSSSSSSQGLANMRGCTELLEGSIAWNSPAPRYGKGTEVLLIVPFS